MDYEWDLFVSYRREEPVKRWVTTILVPSLREWLPEKCGRPVRIFLDVEQGAIEAGDDWPDALARALNRSRCVLPVLDPTYFHSGWCVAEFETTLARVGIVGHQVVVPVQFNDGDFFDARAQQLQQVRMEAYNHLSTPSRARATRGWLNEVRALCATLGPRILNASPFDPAWPTLKAPPAAPSGFALPGFGGGR